MTEKIRWQTNSNAPWLLPKESREVDAGNWQFLIDRAVKTWFWEAIHRRSIKAMFLDHSKSEVSGWERFLEGAQIALHIDFGDRASNGLLKNCLVWHDNPKRPSEFGLMLNRAMNNPKISDHNFEHGSRRAAQTGEATVMNVGELRHEKSIRLMLEAMQLFYSWHDSDQVLTLQRNIEAQETKSKKVLFAKAGHGIGSGVMLLILHRRYEEQRKVSTKTAWRTCALAAAMCLGHDNQKGFEKLKKATNPGYVRDQDGKFDHYLTDAEIFELWQKDELDILQTTPSIILKLLIWEKSKYEGFITEKSPHGLLPEFEEEHHRELYFLSRNHRPLIEDINDFDRETFFLAAEVVNQADVKEMIAPAFESLMRTLLEKSYSSKRPFWRSNLSVDETVALIQNSPDNLNSELDHDGRRKLKELLFLGENNQSEVFKKSHYLQKVNEENALMGVLALQSAGQRIMKGDLSIIDEVYQNRLKKVTRKSLRKAGYGYWNRKRLMFAAAGMTDGNGFIKKLLEKKNQVIAINFQGKLDQFSHEIDLIKKHLSNKPDGVTGLKIYSQTEIDHFLAVTNRIVDLLAERFQVPKKRLKFYKRQVEHLKYPNTLSYSSYDSIHGNPKTFVEPDPLVVELYETIMERKNGSNI